MTYIAINRTISELPLEFVEMPSGKVLARCNTGSESLITAAFTEAGWTVSDNGEMLATPVVEPAPEPTEARLRELIDHLEDTQAEQAHLRAQLSKALALGRVWPGVFDKINGDPKVRAGWTSTGMNYRRKPTGVKFVITRVDDAGEETREYEVHEVPGVLQDGRP